ncbi:MAG: patatin family protein [Solirubrobacteraceae bacterium]
MRGAVSGGMVLALDELGLANRFDAVYGASAGALNGMWLVSGRAGEGIATWTEPELVGTLIRRRRLLRGRPVVDVRTLVEQRYEQLSPGLFDAVLASPVEFHPLATDVASGAAVDLHREIVDRATLRRALRASAGLPLLAGPPVHLGERRFVDAGLSAAIPFRAAIDDGASHILVLRSRRMGEVAEPPSGRSGAITARLLRRIDPSLAQAFLTRAEREARDEEFLAGCDAEPSSSPAVMSIRPSASSVTPARLERDLAVVRAGLESGRGAAHAAFVDGG